MLKMTADIVNGAQLPMFMNKNILITGFVTEKASNGLWFEMRTTDNQIVRINLKRPIDQLLEGYVEVQGVSTGKGVNAEGYINFENPKFDAQAYNTLCSMLQSLPNLWNVK
ncbi:unnamed protein product [Phyllotreta striolata]|uniref:Replication protein A 14 kDa subunit n=1 Tax=Phyllotreta striolata TaxID=444603 RepID=A0A9N9TRS4_PHYSR|nr:unnamed protein product [Phyllotreta striolata]